MDPENKISDTSMNTTLTPTNNHIAQTKPRKRRFEAYDLDKQRSVFFSNAYGRAAKRLYKQYIEYGFEPEMSRYQSRILSGVRRKTSTRSLISTLVTATVAS